MRNLEDLSAVQFAKVIDTLDGDRHGQEIAAAWIAKESYATRWAGNSPAFLVSGTGPVRAVADGEAGRRVFGKNVVRAGSAWSGEALGSR